MHQLQRLVHHLVGDNMTEDIFNTAYNIWNSLIEIAMTLFTTSPTAANGAVYSTCKTIFDAISDIALPISTAFFLFAICKSVISTPPEQQLKKFLNDTLKFVFMIGVLANLWDVMGYLMQIADGVTDKVATNADAPYTMTMSDDLKNIISEVNDLSPTTQIHFTSFGSDLIAFAKEFLDIAMIRLLFFIAAIVTLGVIVAACISIINCAYQRILKPLVILPFSSITVAMASGSHESERVATSYIKTFFGLCLSGAFMVVCVKLGVALTNGGFISPPDDASINTKVLFIAVENMVTPTIIAGLVKTVDGTIARFL